MHFEIIIAMLRYILKRRQERLQLLRLIYFVVNIVFSNDYNLQHLLHRVPLPSKQKKRYKIKRKQIYEREKQEIVGIHNIFERTGLFDDDFEHLYKKLKTDLRIPYFGSQYVFINIYSIHY